MFKWLADQITYDLLRLTPGSRVGESVNFFFYDLPKIYVMKPRLLFTFIGMVATGIILIGYFFNLVF